MKLNITFLMLGMSTFALAQNIAFTDANFKNYLASSDTSANIRAIDSNSDPLQIDTDGDGEISVSEASAVYGLIVTSSGVTNIDQMNYFNNLQVLYIIDDPTVASINIDNSPIQSLTVQNLAQLSQLNLNNTALTGVSIQDLPALTQINISNAPSLAYFIGIILPNVSAINLTNLPGLTTYGILNAPLIQNIDLSSFPLLDAVAIYTMPQLTSLNVANGSHETNIELSDVPALATICADANEISDWQNAVTVASSTAVVLDCALGTKDVAINKKSIVVYPNPTKDWISVKGGEDISKVEIFDLSGKLIQSFKGEKYDLSNFTKGVYLLKISDKNGIHVSKIIKN